MKIQIGRTLTCKEDIILPGSGSVLWFYCVDGLGGKKEVELEARQEVIVTWMACQS